MDFLLTIEFLVGWLVGVISAVFIFACLAWRWHKSYMDAWDSYMKGRERKRRRR